MGASLASQLHQAVKDKKADRVRSLLQQGADPNDQLYWSREWINKTKGKSRYPPLHRACADGNLEIVKVLHGGGADPHKGDGQFNTTPLHAACAGGNKEVVEYLIKVAECEVDVRDDEGNTPLHYGCSNRHTKIVRFLVEEGKCAVDMRENHGRTPLHEACMKGHTETVRFLVEEGKCAVGTTDKKGKTPLDVAVYWNKTEVIDYLKSLPQAPPQSGTTDPQSSQSTNTKPPQSATSLTKEDTDALKVLLPANGVEPDKVFLESTLERVQELLTERGLTELATNLRAKLDEEIKEQKQHLKKLEELMTDKDTIDLCYLKLLLAGPPGVGKTTSLNRLLCIFENLCSSADTKCRSTLLANCIQVVALVADDAAEWLHTQDPEEETKLFFGLLKQRILNLLTTVEKESQSIPTDTQAPIQVHGVASVSESVATELPQPLPQVQKSFDRMKSKCLNQRTLEVKARLERLIKTGDYSKLATVVGNTLLNINDIGGQPGFLEMLPALSTGPAMYIIFFDLSKELDKLYKIPFSRDDTIITPYDAVHTVISTICQILSAIASVHNGSRKSSTLPTTTAFTVRFEQFQQISPVAALVGTHKDKLDDPELKIQQVNNALEETVEKFSDILISPSDSKVSFFAVDNYAGTEQSDIGPIREFMNSVFSTHFKPASLPIRPKWLIFGSIIRREYKIVKMDDCMEIGKMLEMDREEIIFCIWYLDTIGTIMHYSSIPTNDRWFRNHVICSPQVIFDSISQLIVASLRMLHSEGHVIKHDRKELIKKGQFSINSIKKYCFSDEVTRKLKSDELIPTEQLIELLKYVNLLSPIIHKERDGKRITYLMPAVLECATQEELTTPPPPDANNPEPLLITFKCGYVPTGTFCGMITQLVSQGPDEILDFVWDLVEDGVKRNLVSFYVDYVNKVTLICHDRCYEARVIRNDDKISLAELCAHVLSVILHILRKLYEKLKPELAFRCSCPKHKAEQTISHICTLVDTKKMRFLCDRQPVNLEEAQNVWIGDYVLQYLSPQNKVRHMDTSKPPYVPTQGTGGPTLKDAVRMTRDVRSRWFDLGIELGMDSGTLQAILKENNNRVDDCLPGMLSQWVNRPTPRASWSALTEALRCEVIDRPDVAAKVESEFKPNSTPEKHEGTFSLKWVRRATWDIRSNWRALGVQLMVDVGTLEAIEMTHHGVGDCFTEMLTHWIQRLAPPPSWSELAEALLRSDPECCGDISKEITDQWCK